MKKIIYLFALIFLASGCVAKHKGLSSSEKVITAGLRGQEYYTLANIWYLENRPTTSHNVHMGVMIPAGTKVNVKRCSGAQIKFSDSNNMIYTLVLSRKSLIDLMEYFNRYFAKENPMASDGIFSRFTKLEKENIKNGAVDFGMTKEAVLMAHGYPPSGEYWTPNIQKNDWKYIEDGKSELKIYFKDNKVVKIDDIELGHKRPFGRAHRATSRGNSQADTSAPDDIEKYKKLLDSGAITKDEYEQKKKQLLGL